MSVLKNAKRTSLLPAFLDMPGLLDGLGILLLIDLMLIR
jgi:hypothetical protein